MSEWLVYILRCADDSLYTGVATDVVRRLAEHNGELPGGARYTRGRRPVQLLYSEQVASRAEACRREAAIKRLKKGQKELLVSGKP